MSNKLAWLRRAGIAEGISFLVLLCIAMPVKYFLHEPMIVKIVGWLHGLLFIIFVSLAWIYKSYRNKTYTWFALAFLAAWIPFGTFFFDRKLKREVA